MAKINLVKLTYQNLLSYGAEPTVINIRNGLHWIAGANGNGKSAMIESIHFVLFGKAYRDITLSSLINNYNMRQMVVELELERIIAGESRTFIIIRGLKPKKFEIYKDSVSKDNRLDEEGKAGIFQSYLETEILGFNEILFKQSIAMSAMSSTPFLEMAKAEKRKFTESILGVSDIEKIKKTFGSDLSARKSDFLQISSQLPERECKLEELEELLENARREKTDDISSLRTEIDEIEKIILGLVDQRGVAIKHRDNKKIEGSDVAASYDVYKNVIADIASHTSDIKHLRSTIAKNIDKIAVCNKQLSVMGTYSDDVYAKLKSDNAILKLRIEDGKGLAKLHMELTHDISVANTSILKSKKRLSEDLKGVPCELCHRPFSDDDINIVHEDALNNVTKQDKILVDYNQRISELNTRIAEHTQNAADYDAMLSNISQYGIDLLNYKTCLETIALCASENETNTGLIGVAENDILELEKKVHTAELLNARLGKLRAEYLEFTAAVQSIDLRVSNYRDNIVRLEKNIKDREGHKVDDMIAMSEEKIAKAVEGINTAKVRITELSDEISILSYIVKMFGDDGIKEYMVKKYIPVLNKSIATVLSGFDVPFSITFDSNMDYTFDNAFGLAKEYKGLSEGQKRRLNFSIYIAFREFINKIGRFSINALFLDEILDTAMDDDGLEDMMKIIKTKVNDFGSVYVISHKMGMLDDVFDSVLDVQFDGTFSSVVQD